MSLKSRVDKLENQNGNKVEAQTINPQPAISREAWLVLFADGGPGWNMNCEQMAEWAAQNGYLSATQEATCH